MDFEKTFDVLVTGAGVAGVAAALECGRAGLHTALVEKTVFVSGLATTCSTLWAAALVPVP